MDKATPQKRRTEPQELSINSLTTVEDGVATNTPSSPDSTLLTTMPSYQNDHLDDGRANAKLKVSALQLAVLAKQTSSVEAILRSEIVHEISSDDDFKKWANRLLQILKARAALSFGNEDRKLFDPNGRSIDGMNIFHLSCQYHAESLRKVFNELERLPPNIKKMVGPDITKLLQFNNNEELRYTPLHVATRASYEDAIRWENINM